MRYRTDKSRGTPGVPLHRPPRSSPRTRKLSKNHARQLPSNYRELYISPNNQFITRAQLRGNSVQKKFGRNPGAESSSCGMPGMQPEGNTDFDVPVLWIICVFVGFIVCRYSPGARFGHTPRMGFGSSRHAAYPSDSPAKTGRRCNFLGILRQLIGLAGALNIFSATRRRGPAQYSSSYLPSSLPDFLPRHL